MICDHCKEEMKDGATVCPHCRKTKRKKAGPALLLIAFLAVVAAGGAFVNLLWQTGRESALRDEALGGACRAASETPSETKACLESMNQAYAGPLDDYPRLANAAAQHVADYRANH